MKKLISILFFLSASVAMAHGEDKLGPNGGYIRMPGAFHTEAVPVDKNHLKVFLLDINWANPSVTNSTVQAIFVKGAQVQQAKCDVVENHFLCTFAKEVNLKKKGEVRIKANREGSAGAEASYSLPLKPAAAPAAPAAAQPAHDMSGHEGMKMGHEGMMDMEGMQGMMHECMQNHKDGKMCNHDMMAKCEEKMDKKECGKMMKKMKKMKMKKMNHKMHEEPKKEETK